jgi:hypothetical protein
MAGKEYIEKTKYLLGIIPTKRETANETGLRPDVELRSPKLSLKNVIGVTVNSENVIEVFRDGSHQLLKQDAINKAKIKVRTSLFSTHGYKWKTK